MLIDALLDILMDLRDGTPGSPFGWTPTEIQNVIATHVPDLGSGPLAAALTKALRDLSVVERVRAGHGVYYLIKEADPELPRL